MGRSKLSICLLLTLSVVVVLSSCTQIFPTAPNADQTGTLTIFFANQPKSLLPDGDLALASLDLILTKTGSTTIERKGLPTSTTSIDPIIIKIGTWDVTVNGRNAAGELIASGNGSAEIKPAETTSVSITVRPLKGDGILSLSATIADGVARSPVITGTLVPIAGGSPIDLSMEVSGNGTLATYESSAIVAGWYTLTLKAADGETVVANSEPEAVQIAEGRKTQGTVKLLFDPSLGRVVVSIALSMDDPITITLSGFQSTFTANKNMTVTAATSETVTSYRWFIDNIEQTSQTSATIILQGSLGIGNHRLGLVVNNASKVASTSAFFTIAPIPTFIVTYDGNGQSSGSVPVDATAYQEGQSVTVLGNTDSLTKTGLWFSGWNSKADGSGLDYLPNTSFVMPNSDYILFAKWGIYQIPKPTITPSGGIYTSSQNIAINCEDLKAKIYYTIDGSEPSNTGSLLYIEPIYISSSLIIKAIAIREGAQDSLVISENYNITGTVPTPDFSLVSGSYFGIQELSITCQTGSVEIRYTLDGTLPTETYGMIYSKPIVLSSSKSVRAIAYKKDWISSSIAVAEYTLSGNVSNPNFSYNSNTYTFPITLIITSSTPESNIYYTLDGTSPTLLNGFLYTDPIQIDKSCVVKAFAYKDNWNSSSIISCSYTITGTVATPVLEISDSFYDQSKILKISTNTPDSKIIYTMDGSVPRYDYDGGLLSSSTNGTAYAGEIMLSNSCTVKAIAVKSSWATSLVVSEEYNIEISPPIIIFSNINDQNIVNCTILTLTKNCAIRYCVDGSEPSNSIGIIYSGTFTIEKDKTIKAIAYKSPSQISSVAVVNTNQIGTLSKPIITSSIYQQYMANVGSYYKINLTSQDNDVFYGHTELVKDVLIINSESKIGSAFVYFRSAGSINYGFLRVKAFKSGYYESAQVSY